MVSSSSSEEHILQPSSIKELDVVSIETGDDEDSPLHTPTCEEMLEVETRAVARLNIEKQEVRHKRKFACHPDHNLVVGGLLFFFDLQTEETGFLQCLQSPNI